MLFPSNNAPQAIGRCRLNKLPQSYRDAFRDGEIGAQKGLFVGARPSTSPVRLYLTLALGLVFAFVIFPLLWGRLGARDGRIDIADQPANTQLLIYGTLMLLSLAIYVLLTAVYRLWIDYQLRHGQATGQHHFGLLLDGKNLVGRLPQPGLRNCYFLPRDHLQEIRCVLPERGNGRSNGPARLALHYVDGFGRKRVDVVQLGDFDGRELEAIAARYARRIHSPRPD